MAIEVFEPVELKAENDAAALVLINSVGNTVSQDIGRDAQEVADGLGIVVVGVDRPGTAGWLPRPALKHELSTPAGYVREMMQVGCSLERQLDSLGIERTTIVGRSAGGLGALALTRTESISTQRKLHSMEPVAFEAMPVPVAKQIYRAYGRRQKNLQNGDDRLIVPRNRQLPVGERFGRLVHMLSANLYDHYHNDAIWCTAAALEYAGFIAEHQPAIDTIIEFAEYSLQGRDEFLKQLARLGSERPNFKVLRTQHTTHASYDSRQYLIERLKQDER